MKKTLVAVTIIGLLSLPAYALGQCCCCGQAEAKKSQAQNPASKNQSCCPAPAVKTEATTSPSEQAAPKNKSQDQLLTQESKKSGTEKN
jgi:hypothetical protein